MCRHKRFEETHSTFYASFHSILVVPQVSSKFIFVSFKRRLIGSLKLNLYFNRRDKLVELASCMSCLACDHFTMSLAQKSSSEEKLLMCISPVCYQWKIQFIGVLWVQRERKEGLKVACAATLQVAAWWRGWHFTWNTLKKKIEMTAALRGIKRFCYGCVIFSLEW